MNIYKLTQNDNRGWDTFDSMIVIAKNEEQARIMYPHSTQIHEPVYDFESNYNWLSLGYWANSPDNVKVEHIGKAFTKEKSRIVLASFNAG